MVSHHSQLFDFFGLVVEVSGSDPHVLAEIDREFKYFKVSQGNPSAGVEVLDTDPGYTALPHIAASIHTPDYVVYKNHNLIYTDYHHKGLRTWDRKNNYYRVFSQIPDERFEITRLSVLAAVGSYLDSQHIHRVHALGITVDNKAVLILLPEHGGKSLLALSLLGTHQYRLISEESPLISGSGEILPFPSRIRIAPGLVRDIPGDFTQCLNLEDTGSRVLVDLDYYQDCIAGACRPWLILIGEKVLGNQTSIQPCGKQSAVRQMITSAVIGLGVYQGLEYLLCGSFWQTAGRGWLALSRLKNSLQVVRQSRVYRFQMGYDADRNAQVLLDFLEQNRPSSQKTRGAG